MSDTSWRTSPRHANLSGANSRRRNAFFYGWWVVVASAVGLFWGVPVSVYSFSVFFKPLMQEFHAGRAAVSLGFTLHLAAGALSAPLAGWLTSRYGARRVILPAAAMFGRHPFSCE